MPAIQEVPCDAARETTVTTVRLPRAATTPSLARHHVQRELATAVSAERVKDFALLTSEVVTNAVEYSQAGAIELAVKGSSTLTRIEVSNPGQSWGRRPETRSPAPDEVGGWGLFLVEQLSDRWGTSDNDSTVWFEFDHPARGMPIDEIWGALSEFSYPATRQDILDRAAAGNMPMTIVARLEGLNRERYENVEQLSGDLMMRRAESNTALVAITAEACARCGFPRVPGESHSCLEEKARFADAANLVTAEFDAIDERARA